MVSGKHEEEIHYLKRMSGVLYLYFTLLVENKSTESSLNLKKCWQWISDVLNLTPRPNITAEILTVFFKCCGYKLQATYGKQFVKLINVCANEFFELIRLLPSEKQSGASIGRLQSMIDQFKRSNRFPEWKSS